MRTQPGTSSPKPSLKEEPKIGEQSIISPKTEKCRWGTRLSFLQKSGQGRLGWQISKTRYNGKHHPNQKCKGLKQDAPQTYRSLVKRHQLTSIQARQKPCQQWEAEIERLNTKYNLDCFSDSELDSESNKGEQYHYEHRYEMLI